MIKNILVSVSGSQDSLTAAKYAICLSKIMKAKLFAVYVINSKVLAELLKSRIFVETEARDYERDLEQQGKVFLERIGKLAEAKSVNCETILLNGSISDEVIGFAKQVSADILVIGEMKELASRCEAFYEEGESILRKSACPVISVKNQVLIENLYKEIV